MCRYLHDKDGFVKEVSALLEETVALPSDIATVNELLDHANATYTAVAITNSFVKSVRVTKEIPSYYSCLQCWVCGADDTQDCSSCKVAWKKSQSIVYTTNGLWNLRRRNVITLNRPFRETSLHLERACYNQTSSLTTQWLLPLHPWWPRTPGLLLMNPQFL